MWNSRTEVKEKDKTMQYQLCYKKNALSFRELLKLWQENERFIAFYTKLLAEARWAAYFWEMPPLRQSNLDQPAAFVLVNSPQLASVRPDFEPFRAHFSKQQTVASFMNLGGDARLLAPSPQGADENYAHLANFVRHAPVQQQIGLFRRLGETIEQNLSENPLWVSTSGLGVHWLHIRLDERPKYYQHNPYRQA